MQTGTEHPNATLIREGMEAFNNGDIDAYADSFRTTSSGIRSAHRRCTEAGDGGEHAGPDTG